MTLMINFKNCDIIHPSSVTFVILTRDNAASRYRVVATETHQKGEW